MRALFGGVGFLLAVGLFSGPGLADWDPPGPPPLQVLLAVETVRLDPIPDDGLNGKSELALVIVAHSMAGQTTLKATATLDLEATHGLWDINIADQLGFECSPASPIMLTYSLTELDNGGKEVVNSILLALVRAAALSLWNPAFAAKHLATGMVTSLLLPLINGHDDLGSGGLWLEDPAGGDQLLEINGPDGGAQIHIRTVVNEIADTGQCAAGPQGEPSRGPEGEPSREGEPPSEEEIGQIYKPLHDDYWKIWWEMEPEGGSGLSRAEFYRIQKTYTHLFLAVAGAVALDVISAAHRSGADVREAWRHFEQGIRYSQQATATRDPEARDRSMERALESFERAATAAARTARQVQGQGAAGSSAHASLPGRLGAGLPPVSGQGSNAPRGGFFWAAAQSAGGFEPPLFLLLLPDYLAVKAGSAPGIGAFVVGAEAPQVTVAGAPAGLGVGVDPLDAPGKFVLRLDTQGLAPGTYTLTVTATAGGESTSRELTLVVE